MRTARRAARATRPRLPRRLAANRSDRAGRQPRSRSTPAGEARDAEDLPRDLEPRPVYQADGCSGGARRSPGSRSCGSRRRSAPRHSPPTGRATTGRAAMWMGGRRHLLEVRHPGDLVGVQALLQPLGQPPPPLALRRRRVLAVGQRLHGDFTRRLFNWAFITGPSQSAHLLPERLAEQPIRHQSPARAQTVLRNKLRLRRFAKFAPGTRP